MMSMPERNCRRKTPSFSSSLLDSILRSIDQTNTLHQQQTQPQPQPQPHDHDDDPMLFFASQPKRTTKLPHDFISSYRHQQIMIDDQWMDSTDHHRNRSRKTSYLSWDSSTTTGTTMFTPASSASSPLRKSTPELRPMKHIYGHLKKPMSPGSRVSAFIRSLFASSKKPKIIKESCLKNKSRSDATSMTCANSFSRSSCIMSKKQHSHAKRSVSWFYPDNDTLILHPKSTHHQRSPPISPSYDQSRRWFAEKNYKSFMVEDDEDDDLFELEIVGGLGTRVYTQELPVFETTDLRKIRI